MTKYVFTAVQINHAIAKTMNNSIPPRDDFDAIRSGFKVDKKTDDFTINVRDRNREALQAIVAAYDITLPARTIMEWRACAPHRGTIQGFEHLGTLAILCTDGVVGWFLRLGITQRAPQAHGEESISKSPEGLLYREDPYMPPRQGKPDNAEGGSENLPSLSAGEKLSLAPAAALFFGHIQHFSGKVVCPFTNTQASGTPSGADETREARSKEKRASLALRVNAASKLLEALGLVGMTKTNL